MNGVELFVIVILVGLSCFLYFVSWRARKKAPGTIKLDLPQPAEEVPQPAAEPPDPDLATPYEIATSLADFYEDSAHPDAFLSHPKFLEGVTLLNQGGYSNRDLVSNYHGDNVVAACMALEAYAQRDDEYDLADAILANINAVVPWTRYFALRALNARSPQNGYLIGGVLARIDESWRNPLNLEYLRDFLKVRLEAGEEWDFLSEFRTKTEAHIGLVGDVLEGVKGEAGNHLRIRYDAWRRTRTDLDFLGSVGLVWGGSDPFNHDPVIEHEELLDQVETVETEILKSRPRSVLLVGDSGVGKSTLVRVLGKRLQDKGWHIFEAGHTELVAGKIYIGEVEERLRKMLHHLGGKRKILWYIPDFFAILFAGRHQHSSTSALDFFLPHIEQGEITVIGEIQPLAFERLIQFKPKCRTAMEIFRIDSLSEEATLEVARQWADQQGTQHGLGAIHDEALREAWQLTNQYLSDKSAPGNLLQLLIQTRDRLLIQPHTSGTSITGNELVVTLSHLTGLPAKILDDRQSLDLQELRTFFEKRVRGQPEAIESLVDRVALIKAAVGDPTRPQGVFLFVGPTGTGKTEIAKALSEYLFGSPSRMIRLDMSEFQEPDSLDRILGGGSRDTGSSLVDLIRKQPFSVVLLDEFEKANYRIWDLFLQVFDDGRLTDRSGITADFRHAIIIMTSNLGSAIPSGTSLGFSPDSSRFSPTTVEKAVNQAFRKEFLNRIDRVIVFRPLGRDTMREILRKELEDVFQRRGLRNREWAVEWEDAAIEFLLEKGFTPDLGARPLKRAIERFLLTPLATTIVNHQFPEGDQFLFVRSGGKSLRVEFVDPDAPEEKSASGEKVKAAALESPFPVQLEEIAFEAEGTAQEMVCLRAGHERLSQIVGSSAWQSDKQAALALISSPDFWNSAERFVVLGKVEYLDRIESGFESAGSLLRRLAGNRAHYPRDLVQRLAQQLYLLDRASSSLKAQEPSDTFLLIQAGRDSGETAVLTDDFARRLGGMYRTWAKKRHMQTQVLEESAGDGKTPYRLLLALSGFAAFAILRLEDGLHVLEIPDPGDKSFKRYRVQVRILPQPHNPAGPGSEALRRQALETYDTAGSPNLNIVRRYRELPSPLVRDSVRGWRTGRLDRVFEGDFDLIVDKDREP